VDLFYHIESKVVDNAISCAKFKSSKQTTQKVNTMTTYNTLSNIKLRDIKKEVELNGGTYKKERLTLNGNAAYTVNGETMTVSALKERFAMGAL